MSYNISIQSFNKNKNDQIWEQVFHGDFIKQAEQELLSLNNELKELDQNPNIDIDFKLQEQETELNIKKRPLANLVSNFKELQQLVNSNSDDSSIREQISVIDDYITSYLQKPGYSDSIYPLHYLFTELFQSILQIDVKNDYHDTLSLVPTQSWINLYKNINSNIIHKVILELKITHHENQTTTSDYIDLIKNVREVIKYCSDNNAEIQISDELYDSESDQPYYLNDRTQEIMDKFVRK